MIIGATHDRSKLKGGRIQDTTNSLMIVCSIVARTRVALPEAVPPRARDWQPYLLFISKVILTGNRPASIYQHYCVTH